MGKCIIYLVAGTTEHLGSVGIWPHFFLEDTLTLFLSGGLISGYPHHIAMHKFFPT